MGSQTMTDSNNDEHNLLFCDRIMIFSQSLSEHSMPYYLLSFTLNSVISVLVYHSSPSINFLILTNTTKMALLNVTRSDTKKLLSFCTYTVIVLTVLHELKAIQS